MLSKYYKKGTHRLQVNAVLLSLCFWTTTSLADIFDELDDASSEQDFFTDEGSEATNKGVPSTEEMTLEEEFQAWKAAEDAEFNAWKEKYFAELKAYKDKILEVWDEAEVTNNTTWVEYSEDLSTKKVIDYEKNEIRVSIAGDEKAPSEKEIQKFIEGILATTPNEARKSDPVLNAVGETSPSQDDTSNQSMLAELNEDSLIKLEPSREEKPKTAVLSEAKDQTSSRSRVTPETGVPKEKRETRRETTRNLAETNSQSPQTKTVNKTTAIAKRLSKTAKVDTRTASSNKPVTTITIKLPNDATYKRSKSYANEVAEQAKENKMDPSLIFAIMHTESAFNPMARSPIPAFGLMQIVPGSAGKDVTQQWYGQAKLLKPNELFNAETNIKAGATYLNILYYRYLKGVSNPESRKYCVIAAYNTGAGNVSEAFIGSKKIRKFTTP